MRFFFSLLFLCFSCCASAQVLVSIPPQKYLVERLAGKDVAVVEIVPRGASPHSFEPSPKDLERIVGADVWFTCGESFERRLAGALGGRVRLVSQLEGLRLIGGGCACHSSVDTHVWLSPSRLMVIAKRMASVLSEVYPEKEEMIAHNLHSLLGELETLDQEIRASSLSSTILVSHPAFGYFCEDYGIEQVSIEVDGKEPSPRQASKMMESLRGKQLQRLYFQQQYHPKAAHRFAEELSLSLYPLDPYAEDVVANLRGMQEAFKAS